MPSNHLQSSIPTSKIPARRLWMVSDTKVPTYPAFYPRPSKSTSCCISSQPDAPPAVIARRISECLLARSVIADYDDESVTATCFTVDRCLFVVRLWRVPPSATEVNDAILVECIKTKGNSFSFHRITRAILQAAQGIDSGKDVRRLVQSSPIEYPRFVAQESDRQDVFRPNLFDSMTCCNINKSSCSAPPNECNVLLPLRSNPVAETGKVDEAFENIVTLLRKDRLGPQIAGMEQLVSLTDPVSVGLDVALQAASCVLGHTPSHATYNSGLLANETIASTVDEIHKNWILELLVHRRLPTEPALKPHDDLNQNFSSTTDTVPLSSTDEDHVGKMRSLVLRIISNSLCNLSKYQPSQLESILSFQSPVWTSEPVLASLIDDIQKGAFRPVKAVYTTRLSSPHDTAIACRILRILCKHNPSVKRQLAQQSIVFEYLEQAQVIGKSTHLIMSDEAHKTHQILADQSC